MGSDPAVLVEIYLPLPISIHAPARGATIVTIEMVKQFSISIHAPAWGATRSYISYSFTATYT